MVRLTVVQGTETDNLPADGEGNAQPTAGFARFGEMGPPVGVVLNVVNAQAFLVADHGRQMVKFVHGNAPPTGATAVPPLGVQNQTAAILTQQNVAAVARGQLLQIIEQCFQHGGQVERFG